MLARAGRNLYRQPRLDIVNVVAAATLNILTTQQQQALKVHTAPQQPLLAGHSKWANIKHIKAQKDGEKAAVFARMSRQIRLAIQEGGSPDPALNSHLRNVVDLAVRQNMPMSSIMSTIKRSQQSKAVLKRHRLEMRFKQKVFLVCVLYTDNMTQVKIDLATIMRKTGATIVEAVHLFDDFGLIETTLNKMVSNKQSELEEHATEDAIECGAEEVDVVDASTGAINFICNPIELNGVSKALEGKGYKIHSTEHIYAAKSTVQLTPEEQKAYNVLTQKLLAVPGFEDIYDNVEVSEDS